VSPMNIDKSWIVAWVKAGYDTRTDEVLDPLKGVPAMGLQDLHVIDEWKQQSVGPRRIQNVRSLGKNDPMFAEEVTRRAFRTDDDLAALVLMCVLKGVGPSVASAVLMAQDPERYTVADPRAWATLVALLYFDEDDDRSWEECWLDYLRVCRKLADSIGVSLRDLDHASWAAKGDVSMPGRIARRAKDH